MELSEQKNTISPPPSGDADVEIRTMASDIELAKSGASETSGSQSFASTDYSQSFFQQQNTPLASGEQSQNQKISSSFIIIILGIFVLAGIIGFGSYYLASKIF